MVPTPAGARSRLETEHIIWLASVRPDGRPHLVPLWFVWHADRLYVCVAPDSVKGRNVQHNPHVALALEDGSSAVICEGTAVSLAPPWPAAVIDRFQHKYGWNIAADRQYTQLIEVHPHKWLVW